MSEERRAGQHEMLEKVTRIDERTLGLSEDMREMKGDIKSLKLWVNIGRGALAAVAFLAGLLGLNGLRNG